MRGNLITGLESDVNVYPKASDDGATYRVEGQDLSAMVGKTVRAIGTLSEKDGGKTLTIINIEPVEE